jgi:hypothetical protein
MSRFSKTIKGILRKGQGVGLDRIIGPEVWNDEFYLAISRISSDPGVRTILEIGASSGRGSTAGLAEGMKRNPSKPQLYAVELSMTRFQKLTSLYKNRPDIHCYNVASVSPAETMSEEEVVLFCDAHKLDLKNYRTDVHPVLVGWLREENSYITEKNIPTSGIEKIKSETGIAVFDFVLIDGGPFTGRAELAKTYGAKFIALDDIMDIKNFDSHETLSRDPNYELIALSKTLRNGFSIFERRI